MKRLGMMLVLLGVLIIGCSKKNTDGAGGADGKSSQQTKTYFVEDWISASALYGAGIYDQAFTAFVDTKMKSHGDGLDFQVVPKAFLLHSSRFPGKPFGMEIQSGAKVFRASRQSNGEIESQIKSPFIAIANSLLPVQSPRNGTVRVTFRGSTVGFKDVHDVPLKVSRRVLTHDGKQLELVEFESGDFTLESDATETNLGGGCEGHMLLYADTKQAIAFRFRYSARVIAVEPGNGPGPEGGIAFVSSAILVDSQTHLPVFQLDAIPEFAELTTLGRRGDDWDKPSSQPPPAWVAEAWGASRLSMVTASAYAEGDINPIPLIIAAFALAHVTDGAVDLGMDWLDDQSLNNSYESPLAYVYKHAGRGWAGLAESLGIIDESEVNAIGDQAGEIVHFVGSTVSSHIAPVVAHSLWGRAAHLHGLAKESAVALGKLIYYGSGSGASPAQKALQQIYKLKSNKTAAMLFQKSQVAANALLGIVSEPTSKSTAVTKPSKTRKYDAAEAARAYIAMCPRERKSVKQWTRKCERKFARGDIHGDCAFILCAVEVGKCDNEEPGDASIQACMVRKGWAEDHRADKVAPSKGNCGNSPLYGRYLWEVGGGEVGTLRPLGPDCTLDIGKSKKSFVATVRGTTIAIESKRKAWTIFELTRDFDCARADPKSYRSQEEKQRRCRNYRCALALDRNLYAARNAKGEYRLVDSLFYVTDRPFPGEKVFKRSKLRARLLGCGREF